MFLFHLTDKLLEFQNFNLLEIDEAKESTRWRIIMINHVISSPLVDIIQKIVTILMESIKPQGVTKTIRGFMRPRNIC
jgi:hypothetical protein